MIPKIIHFVWVGDAPKSELVQKCMDSWKKYCPDYQIMEWGNGAVAQIDNAYVQEAFKAKKWAFVSDYIRLYALNKFGGFYFDSDLEITDNIDKFRDNKFVTGYESYEDHISPFTAFMGASQDSLIIKDLFDQYHDLHFIQPDGTYNQTTNTARVSEYFGDKYGVNKPYDGTNVTNLGSDGVIYPYWFFCTPLDDKPNYSIHLFNGSWLDGWKRKTKFQVGAFSFVRFKRIHNTQNIPLATTEKILLKIPVSAKKFFAIIRTAK